MSEINKLSEKMYLDYFNNFLTVEKFSEHYNIPEKLAIEIINNGRELRKVY